MDTVYPGWAGNMLCRIAKIMDPEKIDYIVCNHMEPDHAGSLAEVVARVKPEKIFVSTLGYKSMQGYFDCKDGPIEVVKSGDKLNIGKRNIIFQETRMLHWPDSMVSYIPEDKLLISNDAFGQNIATSYRYADEHDQGDFVRAIKEYYYNICLLYTSYRPASSTRRRHISDLLRLYRWMPGAPQSSSCRIWRAAKRRPASRKMCIRDSPWAPPPSPR